MLSCFGRGREGSQALMLLQALMVLQALMDRATCFGGKGSDHGMAADAHAPPLPSPAG
ncbi:MAG: hypothetical protein RLZZ117_1578 [Cyanobacteriota bacterium]